MSEPTTPATLPSPPLSQPPSDSTLNAITEPRGQQKTVWTVVAGVCFILGSLATTLASVFESKPVVKINLALAAGVLMAVSVALSQVAALFARSGGVKAAGRVREQMDAAKQDKPE